MQTYKFLLEQPIFLIQFFLHDVACAAVHINFAPPKARPNFWAIELDEKIRQVVALFKENIVSLWFRKRTYKKTYQYES